MANRFGFPVLDPKLRFTALRSGKMMTAIVIVQAIEEGLLAWNTRIETLLGHALLDRLFVVRGVDYTSEVTVEHLLGHRSGINDYFEGKSDLKPAFLKRVIASQDVFYKPTDLLDVTRNHQTAIAPPGTTFFYSDTGYILLGLLAEHIYRQPFDAILRERIFNRLGMKKTGLLFYDPFVSTADLEPVMVQNVDLRLARSLSIDFSGGGLATTAGDLTLFLKALHTNQLVSAESLAHMALFEPLFRAGMFYGYGLMEMRFEKLFFLLKGLPRLRGHLGVLGVHAWFNPQTGDTFVINVGNMNQIAQSFQLLIQCVVALENARKQSR
ncbi:MAG: beta-lactamase family protein [Bacillus subtilis]|nr:beta-lactamase family protein [Bacillus subtilis]